MPFMLVWGLQMKQSHKVWVVLGFTVRLMYVKLVAQSVNRYADTFSTIPLAVLRLLSLSESLASNELIFDYATTEVFTQGELCFSVISATIPCLRIFMQSANTGLLGKTTFDSTGDRSKASYIGSRSGNFGISLRSQDQTSGRRRANNRADMDTIELHDRIVGETLTSAVAASDKQSVASDSSERAIIVKQTVDVVYT
jgi:hypothetical protein